MIKKLTLLTLMGTICLFTANAQTIWTGPKMTFTKADGADWTQAANQDRITPNVWITRANNQGIFNIKTEIDYADWFSPEDTEWAFGTTANIGSLTFQSWEDTHVSNPPSTVGMDMVVHLITDDIYIDIKFLSWASGGSGGMGGFSYERSTGGSVGINELSGKSEFEIYPVPAQNMVTVGSGVSTDEFHVYNHVGQYVTSLVMNADRSLNISELTTGMYFLVTDEGSSTPLIVE